MLFVIIFVLIFIAWLWVELNSARVLVRVALGVAMAIWIAVSLFSLHTVSARYSATMQTNQTTKNLTRGLVEIVDEGFTEAELSEFRDNLKELNRRVIPSYEDHSSSQDAIEWFLQEYGIEFEHEIPITSDVRTKEIDGASLMKPTGADDVTEAND